MKLIIYFFLIISCTSLAMEKIWHHTFTDTYEPQPHTTAIQIPEDEPDIIDNPLFQPLTLRSLCLNKIAQLCATDVRFNATSLSGMPPELASGLLERLKGTITGTKCIRSLESKGHTTYKMSPDGLSILAIPSDTRQPLCIHDGKTGIHRVTLNNSLTSDNQKTGNGKNRFVPVKWSTTGRYVYACFSMPYLMEKSAKYLYKVWDAKTGNPLPYTLPFKPCGKLYFSSDDRWLMGKLMNKPLLMYESTSGTLNASLGPASFSYARQKCHDPQHEWISIPHEGNTQLYDTTTLALVRTITGQLKSFSSDGALLATLHEDQARIFNRKGEVVCIIPLKNLRWFGMNFAPNTPILRVFDSNTEHQYSLETKEVIKSLNHDDGLLSGRNGPTSYRDAASQTSITLTKEKNKKGKTRITITNPTGSKQIECTGTVKKVRYTHHKDMVALCDSTKVHFLLHIQTGALIPCNFELKSGTFSHRPIKELSCDEYWINNTDAGQQLMQLKRPVALLPIISMLTQKVTAQKN